jgi:hypothetical protein
MGRAVSWNWEVWVAEGAENYIYPVEVGEFGEGEEGRIEVADGDRKYKIKDQIYNIDEIELTILLRHKDWREYDLLQGWADDGTVKDVWLVARGNGRDVSSGGTGRNISMKYLLQNTQCAQGKHQGFNRKNKEEDRKKFFLIPEFVIEDKSARASA